VLWLTIQREARRNAMSHGVLAGLAQAITAAQTNRSVRAIVITGAGSKAFCAGADLQSAHAFTTDYSEPHRPPGAAAARGQSQQRAAGGPRQRRLHGRRHGLAGHVRHGGGRTPRHVWPAGGEGGRVPGASAQCAAAPGAAAPLAEMCLTGEPITAAEALEYGLVNYVDDDVDAKLHWLLDRLLDKSPAAIRRGLYTMKKIESHGL
jgi:enoyl-CoA hydratase/carnithine racemase